MENRCEVCAYVASSAETRVADDIYDVSVGLVFLTEIRQFRAHLRSDHDVYLVPQMKHLLKAQPNPERQVVW